MLRPKQYITWCVIALSLPLSLQARRDTLVVSPARYGISELQKDNLWLAGNNAAGLIYTARNVSYAEAYAGYKEGAFKNVYDPAYGNNAGLNAGSYFKLSPVYLYGKAGYDYSHQRESQWNGLLNPYSTPFLMADSIPGNYSRELFYIDGGMAVPLSARWTAGAYLHYATAAGAKSKDLRNKNTYMNFSLQPAILFATGDFRIGANFTYNRTTENVDYTSMGNNQQSIYIYFFEGMWYYNREAYGTGTEKTRVKTDESAGGGIQFQFNRPVLDFYTEIHYLHTAQHQWYGEREFGDVTVNGIDLHAVAGIGRKHYLELNGRMENMKGYDVVQHREWHEPSQSYRWFTDFTNLAYTRSSLSGELSYTFRQQHTDHSTDWEIKTGAKGLWCDMQRKLNPYTGENWQYIQFFARAMKKWYWKTQAVQVELMPYYGTGSGSPLTGSGTETGGLKQLTSALQQEFNFMTATRAGISLNLRYYYGQWYGAFMADYVQATGGDLQDKHRLQLALTIGIQF